MRIANGELEKFWLNFYKYSNKYVTIKIHLNTCTNHNSYPFFLLEILNSKILLIKYCTSLKKSKLQTNLGDSRHSFN